jgi:very-short-patch-repair endonuclease
MTPTDALTRLGGVATFGELCQLTSRRRLRSSVGKGEVARVSPGVYALTNCDEARLAAAKVGGVVSHLSAAQYWGWKVKLPPKRPTVTVPRRRSGLKAEEIEVHRADLTPLQVHCGVTTKVQTVIDCARVCPFDVALAVADSALRDGVSRDELLAAAKASPRTGRAKALKVVKAADGRAANPFESVLRAIALEVPGLCVVPQQRVGDIGFVDLFDHRLGLVIEAESYQWHSSRTALARDVRRYTWCARLGYTVVRFTWEEVMFRPDYVRAVLMDLVALGPRARAVGRRTA